MNMKDYYPDLPKASSRRIRRLTADEVDLWRQIGETVLLQTPVPHVPKPRIAKRPIVQPDVPHEFTAHDAPLSPLERRLKQKLLRGRIDLDASLDLHGLRQEAAHSALINFLIEAQRRQNRIVLIITGKGKAAPEADVYEPQIGVLRRALPQWLRAADLRSLVIGFEEAGPGHGGSGAFYVRIRRAERAR